MKKLSKKTKRLITSDKLLTHCGPSRAIRLACDASTYGIGASCRTTWLIGLSVLLYMRQGLWRVLSAIMHRSTWKPLAQCGAWRSFTTAFLAKGSHYWQTTWKGNRLPREDSTGSKALPRKNQGTTTTTIICTNVTTVQFQTGSVKQNVLYFYTFYWVVWIYKWV